MLMIAYIEGLDNSWLTNLTWKAFVYATHPQQWYCAVYWIITTVRKGCLVPETCGKVLVAAVVLRSVLDHHHGVGCR